MKKELKACRMCRRITDSDTCPICGGETTNDWHGYVFILNSEKSQIAAEMGATNGEFALRVR